MSDIENRLRQMGQQFQSAGQDVIKRKVDDPLQALRDRIAQQSAGQGSAAPAQSPSPDMLMGASPERPLIPEVRANSPSMGAVDQESRMAAMIAAAENMSRLKEKERAMQLQMVQEDEARAQDQAAFDPSSYQQVPKPGQQPQPRFQALRQSLAPAAAPQVGAIELSEDPEEQARQIAMARRGQ
jgi:indole-3-glycerol phosphate synthase